VFGEVGLSGEIRPVPYGEERVREAAKLGFAHVIAPQANLPKSPVGGINVIGVTTLQGALQAIQELSVDS
jgi:DNA repair protein RadA/Sms